jgi:hypothetical protein
MDLEQQRRGHQRQSGLSKGADTKGKAGFVYFRKTINVTGPISEATAITTVDNSFTLFVNGQKVGAGKDFTHPDRFDLSKLLKPGENVIAIEGVNNLPANVAPTPETAIAGTENPAGLLFYLRVRAGAKGAEKTTEIISDKSWTMSEEKIAGWEKPGFQSAGWSNAVDLGAMLMLPWRLTKKVVFEKLPENKLGTIRASLVAADPLQVALGRPNREQVVTTRPVEATTLQALEMTNGETLADILNRGAKNLAGRKMTGRELIQQIFTEALGRKANSAELKEAEELVGAPVKKEGVEDFLWAMAMLPEFQLIY